MNNPIPEFSLTQDILLVKRLAAERLPSGLYIPATAQSAHEDPAKLHEIVRKGEVVKAGPGLRSRKTGERMAMHVKPGDKVWFTAWTGQAAQANLPSVAAWDDDYILLRESELLAVQV